jgi:hypothetical protein
MIADPTEGCHQGRGREFKLTGGPQQGSQIVGLPGFAASLICATWSLQEFALARHDNDAVRDALTRIGKALSSADAGAVAALWDIPGLVLADQGARQIASRAEVSAFFEVSIQAYREKGTPTAVPEVCDIVWLTGRIAAVYVDWIAVDAKGIARDRESSFYLMRVGDDGVARIHVAMARTDS